LVKTVNFKEKTYIGDPINTVKIFNEKHVDELMVVDIDSTTLNEEPNYNLIKKLANESRMPLCYGGGIKDEIQAKKIFNLGVEKIAISSAAIHNPNLINKISSMVGNQSVVIVLDIKKNLWGKYQVVTHNGTKKVDIDLDELILDIQKRGAGELVINSVDNDGKMKGYDYELLDRIHKLVKIPLTILGGAGSQNHLVDAYKRYGIIGLSAGSLFIYKGKYKAVLINYSNQLI
jgi:cyclase